MKGLFEGTWKLGSVFRRASGGLLNLSSRSHANQIIKMKRNAFFYNL